MPIATEAGNSLQDECSRKQFILAGDIGGTKTIFGLFSGAPGKLSLTAFRSYPSNSADSLEALIERFYQDEGCQQVSTACFGIAGPVLHGEAKATNLPWHIKESVLRSRFNYRRVKLINDLVALACAIPTLKSDQLMALNGKPHAEPRDNIGLLAAGTGLGEALLIWNGSTFVPCPSEGGHKDFAPRTEQEWQLHRYLAARYGHVSIERVLSGHGLTDIYRFLRGRAGSIEPGWLTDRLAGPEPAAVISRAALDGEDPVCEEALSVFVAVYGAEAGNLALQAMTLGGVYIGGGIGPKIAAALKQGPFLDAYAAKGRMRDLLLSIPVCLITDSRAALWGAAVHATTIGA